jgi:hypothetical protein
MYNIDPFAKYLDAPELPTSGRPLTAEDVERKRRLLQAAGQQGSLLDRANDLKGGMLDKRDMVSAALGGGAQKAMSFAGKAAL